jgi:MFS transporter, DHA1 family, multidrug resistance protein
MTTAEKLASTDAPTSQSDPARSIKLLVVLGALMSFASISTDIYLPAMPQIATDLHTSGGDIEFTLSAFLFGYSFGQLLWGPIGDRYGRKWPIVCGVLLFVAGSAGCAFATSGTDMIIWRVVQAVGACVGPVLARAMVRDLYEKQAAAKTLSTLMLLSNIAPLLGPLAGGQILTIAPWRMIFWVLVFFGLIIAVASACLNETLPRARRSTEPFAKAFSGYPSMLKDRAFLGYALSGGFFYAGIYAYIAGTPFAYISYHHISPQAYGLLFAINMIGIMAANFINGRLIARFGSDALFRFGSIIAAVAGVFVAASARSDFAGVIGLAVPIFIYLSAVGLIVGNSVAGALSSFPHRAGAAAGLVGTIHYGSGILSAAMVGLFSDGTPWTMGWIICVGGLGSFLTARLVKKSA